ncbi:hypothetical protein AC249_AIPGENE24443, partial [Exaiptasia diaphana]
ADLHGTICRARLVVYDFPTTSRRILSSGSKSYYKS